MIFINSLTGFKNQREVLTWKSMLFSAVTLDIICTVHACTAVSREYVQK